MRTIRFLLMLLMLLAIGSCAPGEKGENGSDSSESLNSLVKTTTLSMGDTNCLGGGIQIDTGIDYNSDSVLNIEEINSTSYVCNGLNGGESYTVYKAYGYAHKGLPEYGGLARGLGLDATVDLQQTGNSFLDYIDNHEGLYDFGLIPDNHLYLFISAHFHNEITNFMSNIMNLHAFIRMSDPGEKHANVLTTIESPIFEKLFKVDYAAQALPGRWNNSKSEAKSRVLNFFNMPSIPGYELSDGDISGDTKVDQVNQAVSVIILKARTDTAGHAALMAEIGSSLALDPSGDTALKNEILTLAMDIDIVKTIKNIESKWASIDMPDKRANRFYNHLDHNNNGIPNSDDPDSHIDILVEEHEIKGHRRLADFCNLSFDTDADKYFAVPFVFDSSVSTAKYFTSNFGSEYLSIYSVDDHGTDDGSSDTVWDTSDDTPHLPLAVFDGETFVSRIPVDFFQDQYQDTSDDAYLVPQAFSAVINDNTIPIGTNVYIVHWSDSGYRPTGLCRIGELVEFSRNQYSIDGTNWIGAAPGPQNHIYGEYQLLKAAWLD